MTKGRRRSNYTGLLSIVSEQLSCLTAFTPFFDVAFLTSIEVENRICSTLSRDREQYIMGSSGCFSAPLILSRSNTIHFLRAPLLLFEFSLVLLNKAGCYLLVRDS